MSYVQFTNVPEYEIDITDGEDAEENLLEVVPRARNAPNANGQTRNLELNMPPDCVIATSRRTWRSRLFQKLCKSEGLLFCLLGTIFITNCAARGYLKGVVLLIQHTLNVSDGETVVTDVMFDFGIFVGALGIIGSRKKINRPKLIGCGALTVGIGCFISSGPYFGYSSRYFLYSKPEDIVLGEYELCQLEGVPSNTSSSEKDSMPVYHSGGGEFWMVLGSGIMGLGAAPQFTAGLPLLEDAYKGRRTPFLVAMTLSSIALGTWFGELLGFAIQHGGDRYFYEFSPTARWWLGFMLCGLHLMLFALLVFTFQDECPQLRKDEEHKEGEENVDQSDSFYYMRLDDPSGRKSKLGMFLKSNVNIVFLALGLSLEGAALMGFTFYQPRFYGTVTGVGVVKADIAYSSTTLIALVIGFFLSSGYLLAVKLSQKQLARMVAVVSILTLLTSSGLFVFDCTDAEISGVENSDNPVDLHEYVNIVFNQTDHCGKSCTCAHPSLTPICGHDGVTYLSPCIAGCTKVNETKYSPFIVFDDCSCVDEDIKAASPGPCPTPCPGHKGHMGILFLIYILTGLQICPAVFLLLRGSNGETRVGTLGFMTVMWRLIGTMPALGYFKIILDNSCMLWSHPDPDEIYYRECQIYHSKSYHFYFLSVVIILKTLVLFLFIGAWLQTPEENAKTIAETQEIRFERLDLDDDESVENEPPPTPI